MMRFIFATLAVLVASPAMGQQYPTIVGEWYAEETGRQDCGTQFATHISPMGYAEETYICKFNDVRRDGWQVTWNGSCSDGSTSEKTKVVALEENGRLSIWFNGNPGWSTLRRCNAKVSSAPAPVERVQLKYTAYAADTAEARAAWSDAIDMVAGFNPPPAVPVTVSIAEAGVYTFAAIDGGMTCGIGNHGCPTRIFKDGVKVGEFSSCQELETHYLSADATRFFDCFNIGTQGRPIASLMSL